MTQHSSSHRLSSHSLLLLIQLTVLLPQTAATYQAEVSDEELSVLGDRLWSADVRKLRLSRGEISVFLQQKTTPDSIKDLAKTRLFQYVDPQRMRKTGYAEMADFINRYDTITEEDIMKFLKQMASKRVFKVVRNLLLSKGHIDRTEDSFITLLQNMWFTKSKEDDSSTMFGRLMGVQNKAVYSWFSFYLLEAQGKIDYYGYNTVAEPRLIDAHYRRGGSVMSSVMFIGTSVEFEMALHTLCMIVRSDQICMFTIRRHQIRIVPAVQGSGDNVPTIKL